MYGMKQTKGNPNQAMQRTPFGRRWSLTLDHYYEMRNSYIQKYTIAAIAFTTPMACLSWVHQRPSYYMWLSSPLLATLLFSIVTTLYIGVTFGGSNITYDRATHPRNYWLSVGIQIVILGVVIYGFIQNLSRRWRRGLTNHWSEHH